MTRIINIMPVQVVAASFVRQPIEFYLAHIILKNRDIFKKARACTCYKIVDCSACELGKGLSLDDVLRAADIVKADEIVLPDIVGKGRESFSCSMKALDEIAERNVGYRIAFVIQGQTVYEAIDVFNLLMNDSRYNLIDTIMIPKWFTTQQRVQITNYIRQVSQRDIHWLGLGDDISTCIQSAKKLGIRSLDTGYFIALGERDMTKLWNPVRNKKIKIDLVYNSIDANSIRDIIMLTNSYNFDAKDNAIIKNIKERQFITWYGIVVKILLIIETIVIFALILFHIKHF